MKHMRLGTRPDTFYTEEATRTVASNVPSDLVIRVRQTTYLLHKFSLVPKCDLLQRICSDSADSSSTTIELHDIPGGENAFELCAKFCYGISVHLSAYNFVSAFCAAKFLQMNEVVEKGNLIAKLEAFLSSCILQGWKDSIVTLQSTVTTPELSENVGIIRRCIDSIIAKILTPPAKVKWSYTYSRPGHTKKQYLSAPRDWWTEDISYLNLDIFRHIIVTIRSRNLLPPQLVGEALHVYACRWLPDVRISRSRSQSSASQDSERVDENRILETIVSLIPADKGSVSIGFLLRILSISNFRRVSSVTKAELVRKTSLQLEEATIEDLLRPAHFPPDQHLYDLDLIKEVLEGYLEQLRRRYHPEEIHPLRSIRKVGELIDTYLQVVAQDVSVPVSKMTSLAAALPDIVRPRHDDLYKAINVYLKEHPHLTKEEKKQLCRVLDCQKLSPEMRAHAVRNEQLPLRTVVQVLFFDQERRLSLTKSELPREELTPKDEMPTVTRDDSSQLRQRADREALMTRKGKTTIPSCSANIEVQKKTSVKAAERLHVELEKKVSRHQERGTNIQRGKEIEEDVVATGVAASIKLTEGTRGKSNAGNASRVGKR